VTVLLDKLDDPPTRDWYAQAASQHGWSRCMLLHQIKAQTHVRVGAAPSNFAQRLPSPDSDLAHSCARAAGHRSAGVDSRDDHHGDSVRVRGRQAQPKSTGTQEGDETCRQFTPQVNN
jgi:hypothetical protein